MNKFYAAFHSVDVLQDAGAGSFTGHYPHLRLVSLIPRGELEAALDAMAPHVRDRVIAEPNPELLTSGQIQVMLTCDRLATHTMFRAVDLSHIVTWSDLGEAYTRWLDEHYLPFQAHHATYTPDGLFPLDWPQQHLTFEVVGSCGAGFLAEAVPTAASKLGTEVSCFHTIVNHPTDHAGREPASSPDVRVVVPPLRYMHPATLDNFIEHPDHDRLFAETVEHMLAYMDAVAGADSSAPLFVSGFIEPYMNPSGIFFAARETSNFKYFVRCLNDRLIDWCERRPAAHFVDANEIAAAIGKQGVDEGALSFFGHRTSLDLVYDDSTDAEMSFETVTVARSFDVRSEAFWVALTREVLQRLITLSGIGRVKAVIVDLDNTLWRGLASDGAIGSWNGRPQGIVEALKILKRRGIFLAIASKNDESYIREHWDNIVGMWSEVPLGVPLALEEFDVVKIDFRPKSVTVGEILTELNILPSSAVFVDDNPLEREEVQAAFPELRVLGAELNYIRRELLHSPFTQSHLRTHEDAVRSATVKQQALLQRHREAGTAAKFLESLGLRCTISEVVDLDSAQGQRAIQLINKTNQWNLNGRRVTAAEIKDASADGGSLFIAEASDAINAYGIIAAALVDEARCVTHLVVSCRVIGMGIDAAFVRSLLDRLGPLTFAYSDSGRNRAAQHFLQLHAGADGEFVPERVDVPAHVTIERPDSLLAHT